MLISCRLADQVHVGARVHSVYRFINVFLLSCSCVNQFLCLLQWSKIVPAETVTEQQSSVFVGVCENASRCSCVEYDIPTCYIPRTSLW